MVCGPSGSIQIRAELPWRSSDSDIAEFRSSIGVRWVAVI